MASRCALHNHPNNPKPGCLYRPLRPLSEAPVGPVQTQSLAHPAGSVFVGENGTVFVGGEGCVYEYPLRGTTNNALIGLIEPPAPPVVMTSLFFNHSSCLEKFQKSLFCLQIFSIFLNLISIENLIFLYVSFYLYFSACYKVFSILTQFP